MRDNLILVLCGLIVFGYVIGGYAKFLDGRYVNRIIEFKPFGEVLKDGGSEDQIYITHLTEKLVYHQGDMVYARTDAMKFRDIEGWLQWNLIDARFYGYQPRRGVLPKGRFTKKLLRVERIPAHIPPGKYYFCGLVKYEPNPISDVYVPIRTNEFEVKCPEDKNYKPCD